MITTEEFEKLRDKEGWLDLIWAVLVLLSTISHGHKLSWLIIVSTVGLTVCAFGYVLYLHRLMQVDRQIPGRRHEVISSWIYLLLSVMGVVNNVVSLV